MYIYCFVMLGKDFVTLHVQVKKTLQLEQCLDAIGLGGDMDLWKRLLPPCSIIHLLKACFAFNTKTFLSVYYFLMILCIRFYLMQIVQALVYLI